MEVVLVQLLEGIKGEETGARIGNDAHHSGPHPLWKKAVIHWVYLYYIRRVIHQNVYSCYTISVLQAYNKCNTVIHSFTHR